MSKDIKSTIAAIAVVLLLLALWSSVPYFGLLFSASMLAVGSFMACRLQGWLVVFVIPISFAFLLLGFEDGSFNLQINQLRSTKLTSFAFISSIGIISIGAVIGVIVWYRRNNKLLNHDKST